MSDAVFMGTPLLAEAARVSGDARDREAALRHRRFMVKLNLRPDDSIGTLPSIRRTVPGDAATVS